MTNKISEGKKILKFAREYVPPKDDYQLSMGLESVFAGHYLNSKVGHLHLEWMMDRYWTMVTNKVIIPAFVAIYDKLVAKGYSDKNKYSWGDADGYIYFIHNEGKKVMVYTSQSRDYLITLGVNSTWQYSSHSIHIRRVWRDFKKGVIYDLADKIDNVASIINSVETFEEFNDNNSMYPRRPGLALYAKIQYNLDKFQEKPRFYGDIRDPGYVLSYRGSTELERVDGTKYSFYDIEKFATLYTQHIATELDVEVPSMK